MLDYLKAQGEMNGLILQGEVNANEIERFATSDYRWADNKRKALKQRVVRKGDVYQFEFGKNYSPEMSYEHRGLVLGVKRKLLYVLPIFSYNPAKQKDVYHPVDYPTSKSDLFLLKNNEFAFIRRDSVLKLNDMRTVSINRVLYKQMGRMDPHSDVYKAIEMIVFRKYFPECFHEYMSREETIERLNEQLKVIRDENIQLNEKLKLLRNKYDTE